MIKLSIIYNKEIILLIINIININKKTNKKILIFI